MQSLLIHGTFLDSFAVFMKDVTTHAPEVLPTIYVFVLFSSLTLMNMLVGVLVDVVQAVASTENEANQFAAVKDKINEIMRNIDRDSDGLITRNEFRGLLTDPRACGILKKVEVDVLSLVDLEDYLFEGSDERGDSLEKNLTMTEFMDLVLSLRGSNSATVKDVVQLQRSLSNQLA